MSSDAADKRYPFALQTVSADRGTGPAPRSAGSIDRFRNGGKSIKKGSDPFEKAGQTEIPLYSWTRG